VRSCSYVVLCASSIVALTTVLPTPCYAVLYSRVYGKVSNHTKHTGGCSVSIHDNHGQVAWDKISMATSRYMITVLTTLASICHLSNLISTDIRRLARNHRHVQGYLTRSGGRNVKTPGTAK